MSASCLYTITKTSTATAQIASPFSGLMADISPNCKSNSRGFSVTGTEAIAHHVIPSADHELFVSFVFIPVETPVPIAWLGATGWMCATTAAIGLTNQSANRRCTAKPARSEASTHGSAEFM